MNTTRALTLFLALALLALLFLALPISTARAADPIIVRVTTSGTTTWPCGSSWANPCNLNTALTNVNVPLDAELWVAAGTFTPTTGTDRTATFQLRNDIALYGGFVGGETLRSQRNFMANVTILSGDIGIPGDSSDNAYHVLNGSGAQSGAILDGFTVAGGRADDIVPGDPKGVSGGGMYNYGGSPTLANLIFSGNWAYYGGGLTNDGSITFDLHSNPTLTNVRFISNTALADGGGMYNNQSGPTLTNVTFSDNWAHNGGGMENNSYSNPMLTNVSFSGNSAINGGGMGNANISSPTLTNVTFSSNLAVDGGGAYVISSSLTLTNVRFISNTANNRGGGMYSDVSNPALTKVTFSGNSAYDGAGTYNHISSPTLTNVTFSGNQAADSGGGMYNHISSPMLGNVTFSSNLARLGLGGGMFNFYSTNPILVNVTFINNTALADGGGMSNYQASPILTNVTFSNNSANSGGGMDNLYGSNPAIRNTILWGNTADYGSQINYFSSSPDISDSVVAGGCPSGITCTHVITGDPLLGPLGNYGGSTQTIPLLHGSSAIDTGNDAVCPATDQRGVPRPQGAHCDIGAFEGSLSLLNLPMISR